MKVTVIYSLVFSFIMLMSFNSANAQKQVSAENAVLAESVQQPQIVEVVNDPVTTQATSVNTTVTNPVVLQNQPTNTVIQEQPTNNVFIQKQPTTVVEDSPLSESRADVLRKRRVEMEQQTESMIVEKLEAERIRSEQERARKLVEGLDSQKQDQNKAIQNLEQTAVVAPIAPLIGPQNQQLQQQAVQVVGPQESLVIQQTQIEEVKEKELEADTVVTPAILVKEELDQHAENEQNRTRYFIGLDFGLTNYDLDNVSSTGGIGVTAGMIFDRKYIVEGSYIYSRFDIESVDLPGYYDYYTGTYYPLITEMRQHNFNSAFKYRFLGGEKRFSPYAGGLLSFTYREYDLEQNPNGFYIPSSSSWAMDFGLVAGADLRLSNKFSINMDFKYIFNLAYDIESDGYEASRLQGYQFGNVVEEDGYWQFFVGSKFIF